MNVQYMSTLECALSGMCIHGAFVDKCGHAFTLSRNRKVLGEVLMELSPFKLMPSFLCNVAGL